MTDEATSCRYEIDADDRIRGVGEAWLPFARENDAPDLTPEAVVGRVLWDFIAGQETRDLYGAVLERVRGADVPIVLPFRCDSPGFKRWMRLVITPERGGSVRFDGVLVRKRERLLLGILDPGAARTPRALPMCSCCKRVAVGQDWLEPEDAMVRFHELDVEPYPTLVQALCDACGSLVSSADSAFR